MTSNCCTNAERILVYRLGSLGDFIVALPSLHMLTQVFPNTKRLMLTNSSYSVKAIPSTQILKHTGIIQEYIHYPLKLKNLRAILSLIRHIRHLKPEVVIYLTGPRGIVKILRDTIFFKLCGIRRLIGFPYRKSQQQSKLLNGGLYEYEGTRLLRCLSSLGTMSLKDSYAFELHLQNYEYEAANQALMHFKLDIPFIVASIGTKLEVNDWGDDNWNLLILNIGRHLSRWGLIMIGSEDEKARTDRLLSNWPGQSLNLCGQLSVRETAAVLNKAEAFIGHDSGPIHLAAAVGISCVGIFSSRNLPGEWFPPGNRHHILYKRVHCMGCRLDVCLKHEKYCIRSISVDEVFNHVIKLLNYKGH